VFQAEDGIRDDLVTGVQTCALPIWTRGRPRRSRGGCEPSSARAVRIMRAASARPAGACGVGRARFHHETRAFSRRLTVAGPGDITTIPGGILGWSFSDDGCGLLGTRAPGRCPRGLATLT